LASKKTSSGSVFGEFGVDLIHAVLHHRHHQRFLEPLELVSRMRWCDPILSAAISPDSMRRVIVDREPLRVEGPCGATRRRGQRRRRIQPRRLRRPS
jgi:hypothetical protein